MKINKLKWDDLIAPEWERDLERQIAEEAAADHDSIATGWLDPSHPLFAIPDIPDDILDKPEECDPEYRKIQSVPYNEFDQYWEDKMKQQRKEVLGRNKGSPVSTGT